MLVDSTLNSYFPRPRYRVSSRQSPYRPFIGSASMLGPDPFELSRLNMMAEQRAKSGVDLARELNAQQPESESAFEWFMNSLKKPFDALWNVGQSAVDLFSGEFGDAGKSALRAVGSAIPFSETALGAVLPDEAERDVAAWLNPTRTFATGDPGNQFFGNRVRGRDLGAAVGSMLGEDPTNTDPTGSLFSEFGESGVQDAATVVGTIAQMILDPLNLVPGAGAGAKVLRSGGKLAGAAPRVAARLALEATPEVSQAIKLAGLADHAINPVTIREALFKMPGMTQAAADSALSALRKAQEVELLRLMNAAPAEQAAMFRRVYTDPKNPLLRALEEAESAASKTGAKSLILGPTFEDQARLGQRTLYGGPLGAGNLNRPFIDPVGALLKRFGTDSFKTATQGMTNEQAVMTGLTRINQSLGAGSELFKTADNTLRQLRLGKITADEAAVALRTEGVIDVGQLMTKRDMTESMGRRLAKVGAGGVLGLIVGGEAGAIVGGLGGLALSGKTRRPLSELFRKSFLQDPDTAAVQLVALMGPEISHQVGPVARGLLREVDEKVSQSLDRARSENRFVEQEYFRDVALEVEVGELRARAAAGDVEAQKSIGDKLADRRAALERERQSASPRQSRIQSLETQITRLEMDAGAVDGYEALIREQAANVREGEDVIRDFRNRQRAAVHDLADPYSYLGHQLSADFQRFQFENSRLRNALRDWSPSESRTKGGRNIEQAEEALRAKIKETTGVEVPDDIRIFERDPRKILEAQRMDAERRIILARLYDELLEISGTKPGTEDFENAVNAVRGQFTADIEAGRPFSFTSSTAPELPSGLKDLQFEVLQAVANGDFDPADQVNALKVARALGAGAITPEIQQAAMELAGTLRARGAREPVLKALDALIANADLAVRRVDTGDAAELGARLGDVASRESPPLSTAVDEQLEALKAVPNKRVRKPKAAVKVTPQQAATEWLETVGKKLDAASFVVDDALKAEIEASNWKAFSKPKKNGKSKGALAVYADALLAKEGGLESAQTRGTREAKQVAKTAGTVAAQDVAVAEKTSRKHVAASQGFVDATRKWAEAAVVDAMREGDTETALAAFRVLLEHAATGLLGDQKTIRANVQKFARAVVGGANPEQYVSDAVGELLSGVRGEMSDAATATIERLPPSQKAAIDMLLAMEGKAGADAIQAALAVSLEGIPANSPLRGALTRLQTVSTDYEAIGKAAAEAVKPGGKMPRRPNAKKLMETLRGAMPNEGERGTRFHSMADRLEAGMKDSKPHPTLAAAQAIQEEASKVLPPEQARRAATLIAESMRILNISPNEAVAAVQRWRSLSRSAQSRLERLVESRRKAGTVVEIPEPRPAKGEQPAAAGGGAAPEAEKLDPLKADPLPKPPVREGPMEGPPELPETAAGGAPDGMTFDDEIRAIYGEEGEPLRDAMADAEFIHHGGQGELVAETLWKVQMELSKEGQTLGGKTVLVGDNVKLIEAAKAQLEGERKSKELLDEIRNRTANRGPGKFREATADDVAKVQKELEDQRRAMGALLDEIGGKGSLDDVIAAIGDNHELRARFVLHALERAGIAPKGGISGLQMFLDAGMKGAVPADLETLVHYGMTTVPQSIIDDFKAWRRMPRDTNAAVKMIGYAKALTQAWFLSSPASVVNDVTGNTLTYVVMGGYSPAKLKKYGGAYLHYAASQDEASARLLKKALGSAADYDVHTGEGTFKISELVRIADESGLINKDMQATDRFQQAAGPLTAILGPVGKAGGTVRDNMFAIREVNDNAFRFSAYIQELEKGATIPDAISRARMLFPDYSDMTKFEKTWARELVMWYSFSRKMVPFVLRSAIERPYRFKTLALLTGMNTDDNPDLPEWAKRLNGHHLYDTPEGVPIFGALPGSIGNTASEFLSGNIIENVIRSTNPMIRTIAETATDRDFFTGLPIGFREENRVAVAEGRGADHAPAWMRFVPGADKLFGFNANVDRKGNITSYQMDPRWRWVFETALPFGQWSRSVQTFTGADERKPALATPLLGAAGVTLRAVPQAIPANADMQAIQKARDALGLRLLELPGKPLLVVNGAVVPNRKSKAGQEVAARLDAAVDAAERQASLYGFKGEQKQAMVENARTLVFRQMYPNYGAIAEALERLADAYSYLRDPESAARRAKNKSTSRDMDRRRSTVEDVLRMVG